MKYSRSKIKQLKQEVKFHFSINFFTPEQLKYKTTPIYAEKKKKVAYNHTTPIHFLLPLFYKKLNKTDTDSEPSLQPYKDFD